MDTKYTDIGCLDIPKLWYTYRKNVELGRIITIHVRLSSILEEKLRIQDTQLLIY